MFPFGLCYLGRVLPVQEIQGSWQNNPLVNKYAIRNVCKMANVASTTSDVSYEPELFSPSSILIYDVPDLVWPF